MVKVSGGGASAKAVLAHFKYLTRGEFEIETDGGERIKGRDPERSLVDDWGLDLDAAETRSPYRGLPGRKPTKLVHNIVLSMPAGTPAKGMLAASRAFAREQFALKHRYGLVLHTDQPHPHVHLVVRAMSERGRHLNIRKETLRQWRQEFARHLRAQGIEANATARAMRGAVKPEKRDGIYWAMRDGRSRHMEMRVESAAAVLRGRHIPVEPGKARLIDTRRSVVQGWLAVRDGLRGDGRDGLAREIERFVKGMPPPRTEREWWAERLIEHARTAHREIRPPPSR
ncbi:MAG: relaxase/mobilization nuclease domain-containing protein [Steroidobacteraceae bacterium]